MRLSLQLYNLSLFTFQAIFFNFIFFFNPYFVFDFLSKHQWLIAFWAFALLIDWKVIWKRAVQTKWKLIYQFYIKQLFSQKDTPEFLINRPMKNFSLFNSHKKMLGNYEKSGGNVRMKQKPMYFQEHKHASKESSRKHRRKWIYSKFYPLKCSVSPFCKQEVGNQTTSQSANQWTETISWNHKEQLLVRDSEKQVNCVSGFWATNKLNLFASLNNKF